MRRKANGVDVIIYALLTLVSVTMIYPLINILSVSISSSNAYANNPLMVLPREITLTSYRWVLTHHLIISSYINTIIVTFAGTLLSLFLSATLAFPLSVPDLKGKRFIMPVIIFTMFFSGGMIPNFYLVRSLGWIDKLVALIIPGSLSVYNMILMKNNFEGIPASLKESAYIDGASDLTIFVRIVLPLSKPIIATILLFYAVGRWNSFFNAVIYIRSRDNWTLQLLLREIVTSTESLLNDSTDIASIPSQSIKNAVIVVAILPIMCVYPFLQRYFVKGVMIGAVKG